MNRLYTSPLRVYLLLGFLALVGIYSGLKLPVSLFPNSSKPEIHVSISYGGSTAQEFLNTYGNSLESQLNSLSTPHLQIEKLTADYGPQTVSYDLEFKWGTSPQEALKEVQVAVTGFGAQFPREIRDSVSVDTWSGNGGFLAISFYSTTRGLDELHKFLEPLLAPRLAHIQDSSNAGLWNPEQKEIQIDMDPEKMAALQLVPSDVRDAIQSALVGGGGGVIKSGPNTLDIMMNRQARSIDDLNLTLVRIPNGKVIHLSEVAHVDLALPVSNSQSFKTSGEPSLILFANPKPGGNVKRMAEEIIAAVKKLEPTLPSDIHYKILVDPSEFIEAAVTNVFHEVVLAALLAVAVLFLFIGNLKNVVTAAIEIPMSIVLAFILMRLTGINLNLISLGGLALSAGMNVDASVVVMENIFRHFENVHGPISFQQRLKLVVDAVSEVRFPVIASTIASLVVFLPLAFTTGLSNALLSDLALAVVFSHGFSAVVALILVPTVRLQLLAAGAQAHASSPIEKPLRRLEVLYVGALKTFITRVSLKRFVYAALTVLLVVLIVFALPRLKKEIVGMPDTDWLIIGANTDENTMVRQMEERMGEIEVKLMAEYGGEIQYTFTEVGNPNSGYIMARLKNKKKMQALLEAMQKYFANTPTLKYFVEPWNPSEFRIPNPPDVELALRGGTPKERTLVARNLEEAIENSKMYSTVSTEPNVHRKENIILVPHFEQWAVLSSSLTRIGPHDLSEMARLATSSQKIGSLSYEGQIFPVILEYKQGRIETIEDLGTFPLGVSGKLIPLKALAEVKTEEVAPPIYRENQNELITLSGRLNKGEESKAKESEKQFTNLVNIFKDTHLRGTSISISFEDAKRDLNDALHQLGSAVALSVLLIFLTMVLQFGDVINALLVLVAVPLGFIGVIAALSIFQSTLSLNSVLGVILLNGIAVANSIILVDFLKRLVDRGLSPRTAALEAAQKRLRPILMTSLTTALGMLPIALGFGEGGRILQPLGIAVIGGLGFSGLTTLFVVPALQVSYLEWKQKRAHPGERPLNIHQERNLLVLEGVQPQSDTVQ